ncbi:uncharacterized protein K452DRAFT_314269 [Aplosporella prunicola CBS 121167]|uniref:Zn(2)-C6 fungal-type domain-containing protein n=1 Tax=Aplosporella prunicola CBS 121167 TaxID=1176127 RepID=A0A6A6BSE3_9PEZI|nr:uncharacterized protein K452DRAFT_314269 [Aplosporella prunicola CBS 121167]KAF2147022.1 hypothetical protein K452DRAFT_314269 [Aplosporella prunicola CBS 121167]
MPHSCRDRHLKCVFEPDATRCRKCTETERACVRGLTIRFRPVTTVREKRAGKRGGRGEGGRCRNRELSFAGSQTWVKVPPTVTFAPVASRLEDLDDETHEDDGAGVSTPEEQDATSLPDISATAPAPEHSNTATDSPLSSLTSSAATCAPPGSISALLNIESHHSPLNAFPAVSTSSAAHNDLTTYGPHLPLQQETSSAPSPPPQTTAAAEESFWKPVSPLYRFSTGWPFKSRHEARLFKHYVDHLSVYVDCCDDEAKFARVVPQRAVNYPVLMNAILALSSRSLSRVNGTEDVDSPRYLTQCLEILIPVLDDPLESLDENLLAAIVILRLYEEADDIDEKCHLYGGTRLLNSIAQFVPMGGLGEAASWIFLRQDIYVSLTTGQPLNIDLTNYLSSQAFQKDTPGSWANRMVFVFAKILNYACQQEEAPSKKKWQQLHEEVETWNRMKPWHFRPLWARRPEGDTAPFPEVWMTLPAHVVGQQHYNMASILLATCDPQLSRLGFNGHKSRKVTEAAIVQNLKAIVGLAIGNGGVAAATFHASHILCAFGSYLEDPADREAAVAFLESGMTDKIGWRAVRIIESLRDQWKI